MVKPGAVMAGVFPGWGGVRGDLPGVVLGLYVG